LSSPPDARARRSARELEQERRRVDRRADRSISSANDSFFGDLVPQTITAPDSMTHPIDTSHSQPAVEPHRASVASRIGAIVLALLVLLVGALLSFGTVLVAAAVLGIAYRVRLRRGRAFGNFASWGAATGTMLLILIVGAAIFVPKIPPGTWSSVTAAADSASKANEKAPPQWIQRISPAAAQQATRPPSYSPGMQHAFMIWGLIIAGGMLAGFYGSLAWLGAQLFGLGIVGRWPARAI
jgi:hypothetical protein